MFWDGDILNAFLFFENIFSYVIDLLSRSINLGGGITVSFLGIFIGVALLGLVVAVCRRLYD